MAQTDRTPGVLLSTDERHAAGNQARLSLRDIGEDATWHHHLNSKCPGVTPTASYSSVVSPS